MDRENVINDLQDAVNDDWMWQYADYYAKAIEKAIALLKEQEKAGTWKQIDDDTNIWSCSECDEPFILMDGTPIENKYYYCPHCGAKMKT